MHLLQNASSSSIHGVPQNLHLCIIALALDVLSTNLKHLRSVPLKPLLPDRAEDLVARARQLLQNLVICNWMPARDRLHADLLRRFDLDLRSVSKVRSQEPLSRVVVDAQEDA